jgi:hypothetical protein
MLDEYQPLWPPMHSTAAHRSSGDAWVWTSRTSVCSEPPAHWGSPGSGSLGAPGVEAPVHRVATLAFADASESELDGAIEA